MASEMLGRRDAVTWMKMAMSIKLYLPKLVSAGVVVIGHVPLYLCTSVLDGFSALCPSVIRLLTKSSRVQRAKYRSSEKWADDARACTKGEVAPSLGGVAAVPSCGGKAGRYAIGAATDSSFWRGAVIGRARQERLGCTGVRRASTAADSIRCSPIGSHSWRHSVT